MWSTSAITCSLLIVPGTMNQEQHKSILFPITCSRNSVCGTGQINNLFRVSCSRNRFLRTTLLFPFFCCRNAGPGTEKVHQTYSLQFRPPKLENFHFFLHDPQGKFFSSIFSHIGVMKHTISKNHHFQKKSLLCWGWDPNDPSHATYPLLGNACTTSA